ncbi:bifunctional proline dehydrogenase/L-glutamate gamma-semialdehyde dehydrogenase PutA [Methylocystis parvus]|uniref:Bifunctional protein PutA n=1 Tax=Methylocystis parvus TaxID=134 RepID=A0A6B8M9G9_9HYPH|nr:bifunctional proline dehydrogenase/L-glutamate gamma-semialdehyde dehydrogenase PutA [Methylocystis parvus]QGM99316.1 bifunctional proline dehydrogenase/L-glutamate gamma-semialdehyde dehydrogenase PutA [Methylocystis parvus]WBK00295.1 bifunctional proline dehydrogenase/L-glutamate gamma-semialdehyde dehydrogenase PutA [Methylocystis parvus OBBP]
MQREPPPFVAPYAPPDEAFAAAFLAGRPDPDARADIDAKARALIRGMRAQHSALGGVEDFLHEFSLSSREGLAVMALAESLLRVPDDATADQLIVDKLTAGDFSHHEAASDTLLVQACAYALGLSARLVGQGEPRGLVADLARRLGLPTLRVAARQAMRLMGAHFVFGETIGDALARANGASERFSFDMLGEGARSAADAARYFNAYANAIGAIGEQASDRPPPDRPGISVKLSALHPRYEAISRERVLKELPPRVLELARLAKDRDLVFTIDAEEADRLELSLDVIARVVADPSLAGWDGFGLAVQAYQKRASAVIDYAAALADAHDRRFMLRLVKGAYWDSEIKRAQERGLADYPVFTRKAMTDLNYDACAATLLAQPRIYPQFATHNARSVAEILMRAGADQDFEFQRLHGMGEALYAALAETSDAPVRVYAPVGPHRDLLAYLVRRLIENGANSSFVARAADPQTPEDLLVADPHEALRDGARHSRLAKPSQIYAPLRANSQGVEFGDRRALAALLEEMDAAREPSEAEPSAATKSAPRDAASPIDGARVGRVIEADADNVRTMMAAASAAFPRWNATPVATRAQIVESAAGLLEARRGAFIPLLQSEGGKTLDDALAELREAADMCRYYAGQARAICCEHRLPGPTGEDNRLRYDGRGVFVCISPWNFPLAIFLGQVAAALVAGNAVVAKPAEQTPLIAAKAVALLHEAGVPRDVLQFAPGAGDVGAALVADSRVAGVVFTGSAEVAQKINRSLAAREGAIAPLIAETGGINAMIVDSTALIEQVVDDVLASAFRSAGQRCSALRLLCLQEDIAAGAIETLIGATKELRIGDPRELGVHVGPVIDDEAKQRLDAYIAEQKSLGRVIYEGEAPTSGTYVAPHIIRLGRVSDLRQEVFGPALHVTSWRAEEFDALLREVEASGFGLTFGLQTRIEERIRFVAARGPAGNVYVNRNMIGAVVGSQPFGGFGLSGTGPKAGGPDYLRRFVRETTVTINVASFGGDAALLSLGE